MCRENGISFKNLHVFFQDKRIEYNPRSKEYEFNGDKDKESTIMEIDLRLRIPARSAVAAAAKQKRLDLENAMQQKQIASAAAAAAQQESSTPAVQQQQESSAAIVQPSHIITDQLFDIVDLLQQINNKIPGLKEAPAIAADPDPILADPHAAPLALQMHRINQSAKARKTINISQDAAAWLDSYSTTKGFTIGDLVTLAVMQLKDRIDPK